jgi:hypothetical protein
MFGKNKKEKKEKAVIDIDRALYTLIGTELNTMTAPSDHWVKYKAAVRRQENNGEVFDFRIFDEWSVKEKMLKVVDYTSLDAHPDLIVMEGWYDRKSRKGDIKLKKAA